MNKELKDYFKGDELAAGVWLGKYAYEGEKTPDDMHRRMAKEFAKIEEDYKKREDSIPEEQLTLLSEYGYKRKGLDSKSIYELFKNFKYIIPQGSIMSTLGTPIIASLSNCWVEASPLDSYSGIMHTDANLAFYYKRRGGVGTDVSGLRPKGTDTNNTAKTSTGMASFMHRFSNTTREVAMNGRRGALMLSCSINHPDIMDFIKIKRDGTSITGANISIRLNNEFMKAVENDEDYILRFPCNLEPIVDSGVILRKLEYDILTKGAIGYYKKIKAKEYWDEIVHSAKNHAEPGLLYWDNVLDYDPAAVYDKYKPISTNPCFTGDMKVLTVDGYRTFKDLNNTELDLINKDGEVVKGRVFESGVKNVYEIKTWNKDIITCTEDHRFMTTTGEDIKAKDLKGHRLMPFYTIDTEVNEYTKYGFIQGDGGLSRLNSSEHKGMEVHIGQDDSDIGKLFGVDYIKTKRHYYMRGFNEVLRLLEFDSRKLPERVLPGTFYKWSYKNMRMFLKGLYSANGSIIKGHRISFKSTSKVLIEELKQVLEVYFEIDSYYTTNKKKEVKFSNGTYLCKESYDLNISKFNDVKTFIEEIGFVHKYKQKALEELLLEKAPLVSKVSYEGRSEMVYDFSLFDETHWGVVEGVIAHNCGEQALNANDSCRLMALNLFSFVDNPFTDKAKLNLEKLYKYSYEFARLGDDLIDLEMEYIQRIIDKIKADPEPEHIKRQELELWEKSYANTKAGRRIGLGITALADMLAALGLGYDSEEGMKVTDRVMKTAMEAQLDCTIDLSILRGSFDSYDMHKEFEVIGEEGYPTMGSNKFYETLLSEFPEQSKRMVRYGRRNVSFSTIAPTGSVSLMTQTSSGCEPLFMPFYMRRKKVNPGEDIRVDFVDEIGDSWQEFAVLHEKFKDWLIINKYGNSYDIINFDKAYLQKLFEKSPWYGSTANDIDWIKRNEIQAILQKYTTNAISSTINLPSTVTGQEVSDIYMSGWKLGLKGQTVYVDGSRSGVLVDSSKPQATGFEYKDAVKRPKDLEAEVHHSTTAGISYRVIVGLLEGKPYEVFIDSSESDISGSGIVFKKGKGDYFFKKNDITTNISNTMTDEQSTISRFISMSLRHGTDIKYVVEQLRKADGDMFSFSKSVARVLKKYIPDGVEATVSCEECGGNNVIFEEGCNKCLDCGHSACS